MRILRIGAAASFLGIAFIVSGVAPDFPPVRSVSWAVQSSGTTESLRGLSVVDERTAWASGTKGTVLRTTDGGTTWTAVPVPGAEAVDFRDIEAFGAEAAVIMGVGQPARMFRTDDGGQTWVQTYLNDAPGIFLDAMAFYDDKNGLAVGDPMDGRFFLIRTADGGKTWMPLPPESRPSALDGEAAFAASGTALFAQGENRAWFCTGGTVSRVWRSLDRGERWEAVSSALREGTPSTGGFSVFFFNDSAGIVVGGDYRDEPAAASSAAVSGDGGKTWTPVPGRPPGGFREAVAAAPGTASPTAVAVGPSGSDYSPDLGKSWTPVPGPEGFHTLCFAKKGRAAWAAGRNGLVAKLEFR
ncbi:MAG: YCF48-related protein [Candidatus Aminicenantes bacterium]|nr:YCF48-related protein [Candidatus Aminicenantes bacterium]